VSKLKTTIRYLKYLFSAGTKHDVHSPFVFNLLTNIIENNEEYYPYADIENIRQQLLSDETSIEVNDLGAGSSVLKNNKRKISEIARHSLKSPKYAQLLFRLANHFHPKTILELGTSLGITTLYLALANKQAKVVTIEGSENISQRAKQNFEKLNATNIESVVGNFDDILISSLNKLCQLPTTNCQLDFVYFDGNHRKEPTLRYFEQCLQYAHNDSVFIFDDIHWSDEMEQAWEQIKQHSRVTLTIDLFFIGIVFFR